MVKTQTAPAKNDKPAGKGADKANKPATTGKGDLDGDEEEVEVIPRVAYVEHAKTIEGELDAEGHLTRIPTAFDPKLHLAPKKTDFANEADFLDFRAALLEERANHYVKTAARLRENAEASRKFGDPAQRAKVQRARRLQDQLQDLLAQLQKDGINLATESAQPAA